KIIRDERDTEILRKAELARWYFVICYIVIAAYYLLGFEAVGREAFFLFIFGSLYMAVISRAAVIIVLYRAEEAGSGSFLGSFRDMAPLQKQAWLKIMLFIVVLSMTFLFIQYSYSELNSRSPDLGMIIFMAICLIYLNREESKNWELDDYELAIKRRAQRTQYWCFGISAPVLGGLAFILWNRGVVNLGLQEFISYLLLCIILAGLMASPASIIVQYHCGQEKTPQ
ncbi:MAG: hypothetical protein U9P14_11070, partial [Gemmatimonadota bacterium]|nr:hypothetical protein [Gemmatimonadota bacterium]